MDTIFKSDVVEAARCTRCGQTNTPGDQCRHVRWTFARGGPLDFARHAVDASPYTAGRGYRASDIPGHWYIENGEYVLEVVARHFEPEAGFVFGDLGDLDLVARDIWRRFRPDPERPAIVRH